MSGHSKWATTKRAKSVTDAVRSRIFTKLAKLITVAARQGGGDPESNVQLRFAVDRAREASMPRDNIDRAIARGTGAGKEGALEEFSYDAAGPGGSAFIVEGVTDSKNRTTSELRNLLQQHGGKLGETGSQRWQFRHVGLFSVPVPAGTASDDVELAAIEAGADDTQAVEGEVEVITAPSSVAAVRDALTKSDLKPTQAEFRYVPTNALAADTLPDGGAEKVRALNEALLEHDDVQTVATNVV
jgi:YebC/PmpR family DNA-binding regulatory protein